MTALAPSLSQGRQPFGRVDGNRLRSLSHVKNLQNAFPLAPSTPVKRARPLEELTSVDSENIDPSSYSPSKKARTLDSGAKKSLGPSKFVLKQTESSPVTTSSAVASTTRLSIPPARSVPSTSVAGRSPKSKRFGILSRRRVSSSPFTRVDPPAFSSGTKTSSNGLPFSIDAALSGTIPSAARPAVASPPTLEEAVLLGWLFDIHEDTPEEELRNLVEFSTSTLDISDDESKTRRHDHREKENIPPTGLPTESMVVTNNDTPVSAILPISRKDLMTDESRTPLADLDARDYYAEGVDNNSFIIVPEDKDECDKSPFVFSAPAAKSQRTPSPVESVTGNQDVWKEILARKAVHQDEEVAKPTPENPVTANTELDQINSTFEIWDGEGAKRDTQGSDNDHNSAAP